MPPDSADVPPRRSWPRRFLNRLEVDQAVFFAVALRSWQLLAGPFVLLLVAGAFPPTVQGYYFTFASLLNLQWFAELGLRVAVLNVSSHEWSRLRLDESGRITGDADALSRLVSLGRRMAVWFAGASVVFGLGAGLAGRAFFLSDTQSQVAWESPWTALVAIASVQLMVLPWTTLLDGCGQMRVVNRYRFAQAVAATITAISAILAGAALWTAAYVALARLLCDLWLVLSRYRRFFQPFLRPPAGPRILWSEEIWPLQWRLALQSLLGWFAYSLFSPVLFHYHGAVEAGRMGMTWAALTACQAAAVAWVETRAPLFGMLVARRQFPELDRVYFRVSRVALRLLILGMAVAVVGVVALERTGFALADALGGFGDAATSPALRSPLAGRVLSWRPTLFLAIGLIAQAVVQFQTFYLRAHKRDPLLSASILTSALLGLGIWRLGQTHGSEGAALAWMTIQTGFAAPLISWIWAKRRKEWRDEPSEDRRNVDHPAQTADASRPTTD